MDSGAQVFSLGPVHAGKRFSRLEGVLRRGDGAQDRGVGVPQAGGTVFWGVGTTKFTSG